MPGATGRWRMAAKDVNFSKSSVEWGRQQGRRDALRAIGRAGWLRAAVEDSGGVVHGLLSHDEGRR